MLCSCCVVSEQEEISETGKRIRNNKTCKTVAWALGTILDSGARRYKIRAECSYFRRREDAHRNWREISDLKRDRATTTACDQEERNIQGATEAFLGLSEEHAQKTHTNGDGNYCSFSSLLERIVLMSASSFSARRSLEAVCVSGVVKTFFLTFFG